MNVFVVYFFVVFLLLCSMVFFTASYSNVICVITAAILDWTWLMCLLFLGARVEVFAFRSS